MKNLAKLVFLAVAAIVIVSTVAVLTPRVVRAVAAQLVQDIDSPPRNAWVGNCFFELTSGYEDSCTVAVAPGQIVTIQTISFTGNTVGHRHVLLASGTSFASGGEVWHNQLTNVNENYAAVKTSPPSYAFASSENLTFYATQDIGVHITTDGPQPTNDQAAGLGGSVTLIGYSVNVTPPAN